jgi:hypothetical protein
MVSTLLSLRAVCGSSCRAWHFTGDLPMSRVKFAAKHEYESLANFKILQNVFKAKKVDKVSQLSPLIVLCTVFFCCMYPVVVDLNPLTR